MSLIESRDILTKLCSNDYYRGDDVQCAIQCLAEGKTIGRVRTLEDVGKTVIDEKLKDDLMKSKDKWDIPDNMKWLLPLLLFPPVTPPRREISINAQINGKSVNITYDPHDPEAVKAAETWRKALFAEPSESAAPDCKPPRKEVVRYATQIRMEKLRQAAEPLREYLKAHGDPHTSVIVTQYGVTEMQGERRVKFDSEKAAEAVKSGRWEKSDIPCEEYVCSECGGACWYYGYNGKLDKSRYCPNCGARMEDVT